jgi:hypothetical protein
MKQTNQNRRSSVCEWSVNDVGVSCDPTDVGRTPIHIGRFVIEHVFKRGGRIYQVSTGRMQNAFRFTGGTAARFENNK